MPKLLSVRAEATPLLLRSTLGYLADRVAARLRVAGLAGRTITVRVRFAGLRSVTCSVTLAAGISTTLTLTELSIELASVALEAHPRERKVTLLAVSVSNLVDQPTLQLELPLGLQDDRYRPGSARGEALLATDRSVDAIRARFGRKAMGYAGVAPSGEGHVPEEFRELAEHREP